MSPLSWLPAASWAGQTVGAVADAARSISQGDFAAHLSRVDGINDGGRADAVDPELGQAVVDQIRWLGLSTNPPPKITVGDHGRLKVQAGYEGATRLETALADDPRVTRRLGSLPPGFELELEPALSHYSLDASQPQSEHTRSQPIAGLTGGGTPGGYANWLAD